QGDVQERSRVLPPAQVGASPPRLIDGSRRGPLQVSGPRVAVPPARVATTSSWSAVRSPGWPFTRGNATRQHRQLLERDSMNQRVCMPMHEFPLRRDLAIDLGDAQ